MKLSMRLAAIAFACALPATHAGAQPEAKPIRIGVLNDVNGLYADLAGTGSVVAAQMAADEFKGVVAGRKIEIVSADHQNKADLAASIATRWYDAEGVDAIVDVVSSSAALAVQEIARERRKIVMFSGSGSSDLTGKACSPYGFHWTFDTYALSKGTAGSVTRNGGKSWFFITVDFAFGHALERDATKVIEQDGGKVIGHALAPLNTADFSSYLLKARSLGAEIVALANAGGDMINAIKQSSEFGLGRGGQKVVALLAFISDIHSLGLDVAQGLLLTEAFYWDLNDRTRAWSEAFKTRTGRMPTSIQAGVYSAVRHYLEAVAATGTDASDTVVAKMRAMPIEDMMTAHGTIREDGRVMRDMYLFQVKTPAESKGPWDYYKLVSTIPPAEAFRPLSESTCPLVKHQ